MRRTSLALLCLISLATIPVARAAAQASASVPIDEPVYRDIDRLAAAGLIDTIITGTRPYSQREVLRLLAEARRNLERRAGAGGTDWASRVIDADQRAYGAWGRTGVDAASLAATQLSSPARAIPTDPNGSIDATIDPLAAYRGGRPLANGTTVDLETLHSLTLGRYIALQASPRVTGLRGDNVVGSRPGLDLQLANGVVELGNARIEIGRDYAILGQASTGGLLLSANAPPLDMLRLTNDRPAALPSFLRYLGPLKGELLIADLGTSHQVFPHSKLVAWRLSALPSPRFELGAELLDEVGGNGSPPGSFKEKLIDLFPIINVYRNHRNTEFSNKLLGVDAHWRLPSAAGFEAYVEGAVDDFDLRRLESSLLDDGGAIAGISFSCIVECGRFGARAEYHQTGIRYYTHDVFSSGVEENGVILGDPLGPRGLGTYVTLDGYFGDVGYWALNGAYEVRSGNLYGVVSPAPNDAQFHFVQLEHHPGEERARAMITWEPWSRSRTVTLGISAGVERVTDYAFVPGSDRTNGIAQVRFELRPSFHP